MAITLTTNFTAKLNSVLPLAQNGSGLAVRVVSQGQDTIGTLTASGLQGTATWTLLGSAPAWVTLTASGSTATLAFSGAQYQQDPYEFFVSVTDGVSTANFPIFLEVKNPFSLAANTSNPVVINGTTLNIPSYDSTVQDVQIQGFGLFNSQQSNISFILPGSLSTVPGLNWVTSDEGSLKLRVSEPHFNDSPLAANDLTGGLQLFTTSPVAIPFTIQAYQPGSFYDTPDRTYSLTLSISSQSQKAGTLDFGIGAHYDTVNNVLSLDAEVDSLLGILQSQGVEIAYPLKYEWTHTGPLTGGDGTSPTVPVGTTYSVTGTGTASVTLTVLDNNGLPVNNGVKTVNFNAVAASNTNWMTATATAFKVGITADKVFGSLGDTLSVTLSSPDGFNNGSSNETIYWTITTVPASTIESGLASPVVSTPGPISTGTPNVPLTFQFPTGTAPGNKWIVNIAAGNAISSPTRVGYAQVLVVCKGQPALTVNGTSPSITSSTGTAITPIQLSAVNASSTPVTATFELMGGAMFGTGVLGAPDGLYINSQNQIAGNALKPGTYKFVVAATANGYRRSYSQLITMVVSAVATPLQITNPTSTATSIQDNTTFTISWGISGTATALFLAQIPSTTPIRTVTGAGSAQMQQVGSAVYSIYGTSYYGPAYSVPLVVISSSIAQATALLPAPTIATIDENYVLTANWQPYAVAGSYNAYKGWNITLQTPPGSGAPITVFSDGLENGGTVSARIFQEQLSAGDYGMNMLALSADYTVALNSPPWDASHTFPPALLSPNVNLDNTNLLLGQTLTITLNANYASANAWQVIFPDNTSTGWLPLSTRSIAKSFTTPGAQNIIIQTQNDFGTANPPVKLRRQYTTQIFVVDQQYNPAAAAQGALTGTLGIGGEAGFEITDASTGTVTPQPYEVVIRAVARDTVTNELKLMVATSRFSNASSLLSTMAVDVFPMQGRPHARELITPVYILEASATSSSIPVKITTTTLPSNSFVGKPMQEFKMQATGGTLSYSWFSEGLPPGLKMNTDGTISGTPTALGAFTVNFAVMDSSTPAYIDETTLTFTIPTDLTITTTTLPAAVVGTPYESTVVNTGGLAPYTWAIVAGQAPIGVVIDPNSGVLGGVPCTYNSSNAPGGDFAPGKLFTFTIQVTDAIGAKASKNYSVTLSPAALTFGLLNQPLITAGEEYKLVVPVYGGQSPYSGFTFTDNGIVGTGLDIVNPTQIAVVGASTSTLAITSIDRTLYPAAYPANVSFILSATGGVPSSSGVPTAQAYKFYVNSTTFPNAACYGPLFVANVTTNGTYTATINAIDSVGHIASKTLNITVQAQGSGQYSIVPYVVNTGSLSTPPSGWTFYALNSGSLPYPITSPAAATLPDPINGQPYVPKTYNSSYGPFWYFCYAVKDTGSPTPKIASGGGVSHPATARINNGVFPIANGVSYTSGDTWTSSPLGTADCVFILDGTPSANGGFSFEFEIDGIVNNSNVTVNTAQRFGLNIVSSNTTGITTPVVSMLLPYVNDATVPPPANPSGEMDVDLSVTAATGWDYPLVAEGGTSPYTFTIASGTTLPGVTTGVNIYNLPAFSSNTTTTGNYLVNVQATDKNGVQSPVIGIPVDIFQSASQPIHILSNNFPAYVYVNRAVPANTYYVESDLIANWTSSPQNINSGMSLTSTPATRAYLQGTPTQVGPSAPVVITATSASFGSMAQTTVNLQVKAQQATIVAPSHTGATATIGTQYRVVNNNAIVSVQYVGFQPGDASLPVLVNSNPSIATLGAPGTNIGGQPTTGTRNVTADGFIMDYDYLPVAAGHDTLSFGTHSAAFPDSLTITEVYTALVVSGTTVPVTVSEYTVTQTIAPPVSISGGNPPYSINITGVSDSRFVPINNGTANASLQITVNQFTAGSTYSCSVAMIVTDNVGSTGSATGTLNVTIHQETYITVNFSDYTWAVSASANNSASIILNQLMSQPQLGHAPYSYYVDSVTLPGGLSGFVQVSPTQRVFAYNETLSTVSVADVDQTLTPSGSYNVNVVAAPTPNTYQIAVTLRVVDSHNISLSSTQHVNVVIST